MSERMKRIAIITAIILVSALSAGAKKHTSAGISITDLRFDIKDEETVEVTFGVGVAEKTVKRGHILIITPTLRNGENMCELPFFSVEGKASKAIVQRRMMADGSVQDKSALTLANGGTAIYRAVFPYDYWMESAHLDLDGADTGCCSSSQIELGTIAREVLVTKGYDIVYVPVNVPLKPKLSTADRLAADYPFLVPAPAGVAQWGAETDDSTLVGMQDRENSITIYFHQGDCRIDHSYRGNNESLVKLVAAVGAVQESKDSRITRVLVAGFASPEGTADLNDRLSRERAMALKSFLDDKSTVYGDMVTIYNGREDWEGLRKLVAESDMEYRQEVLDIIDNTPVWDSRRQFGRRGKLMDLHGGKPYRYIFKNFFPLLRNAAYIKVYYENTIQ